MINLSTESTEETENEIAMDAQRHSNPSRNLFLKHSLDAYYRNWVYGALIIPHCASSYLPFSSASRWKRPKTTLGSDSTIDIIPTPPPW